MTFFAFRVLEKPLCLCVFCVQIQHNIMLFMIFLFETQNKNAFDTKCPDTSCVTVWLAFGSSLRPLLEEPAQAMTKQDTATFQAPARCLWWPARGWGEAG